MMTHADAQDWPARLTAALQAANSPAADLAPEALADTGLGHFHFRLPGSGLLARIPKQSQMRLGATDNLAYQAACFERMGPSGHTPRFHGVLHPSGHLPRGALLVEEVIGRPARLAEDLPAVTLAIAAIHALPLPSPDARPPLLDPADSVAGLLGEIDAQAVHLACADVAQDSRIRIESAIQRIRNELSGWNPPERRLIAFDAHPGNFLIRPNGDAVLVDLEKGRYGLPALDVAHATLYTSTTWDLTHRVALDAATIAQAYFRWQGALGVYAAGSRSSWLSLRQAMWLWAVTWCAKWLVGASATRDSGTTGEDWSAELSAGPLIEHVRERVGHYLSPAAIAHVLSGFNELEGLFAD